MYMLKQGFKGSDIYMDPRGDEEETLLEGTCLIAYMPSMNEITHVIETGTAAADTVVEVCFFILSVVV